MTLTYPHRLCPVCNTYLSVTGLKVHDGKDICRLACTHVATYDHGRIGGGVYTYGLRIFHDGTKGDNAMLAMREKTCAGCDFKFRTNIDTSLGEFCFECRRDFGLETPKDANDLITLIDHTPVDARKSKLGDLKLKPGRRRTAHTGETSHTTAAPPPDPAKVAAAIRSMTTYGLTTPLPADLPHRTNYVIAKNGLFEVRSSDIARITIAPKTVVGLTDELTAGVQLNLPPIPFSMLAQTVAFFRAVIKERQGAEAIVRIWWAYSADADHAGGTYELRIPEGAQHVSGASVRHDDVFDLDGARFDDGHAKYLHVMDIHSHNTMNAFWSGVDDNDERKAPEGRLFGVIGKLTNALPEWKWRIRTREGFIDFKAGDIFAMPPATEAIPFTVSWGTVLDVLGQTDGQDAQGRVRLYCPIDPFKDATFPREWLERVQSPSFHSSGGGFHWRGGGQGQTGGSAPDKTYVSPYPCLIYILSADRKTLEEYLVDSSNANGKPTPTGKTYPAPASALIH